MEGKAVTIDLGRCFTALLRKCYLVIGAGLILASLMYFYMKDKPQYYTATASVYSAASGSYAESAQGINTMQLYSNVIYSQKLADRAASLITGNTISAREIRAMASASYSSDSPIMYISATSTNPNVVLPTANALAQSLVIEAQSITGSQAIQVLDQATDISMVQRKTKRNVVIAFAAGAFLAIVAIVLPELLSDRVYRVDDAALYGKLDIIGIIPNQKIN